MRGLKKASDILFTISQIFSFCLAGLYFILMVVFIIFGTPLCTELITKGVEQGAIHTSFHAENVDEAVIAIQATFIAVGVVFFILMAFAIANGIIVGVTKKGKSRALYIINIVFGYLSGVYLNLVAGIFGLISWRKTE